MRLFPLERECFILQLRRNRMISCVRINGSVKIHNQWLSRADT